MSDFLFLKGDVVMHNMYGLCTVFENTPSSSYSIRVTLREKKEKMQDGKSLVKTSNIKFLYRVLPKAENSE